MIYLFVLGCQYLNIALKNNALIDLVEYQGNYEQDQYLVNGQPAWIKSDGEYGLWLSSGLSNSTFNIWMIGSWSLSSVYSDNVFDAQSIKRIFLSDANLGYPQEVTNWLYTDGNGAVVSSEHDEGVEQDDVIVQCIGKARGLPKAEDLRPKSKVSHLWLRLWSPKV